MFAKAILVLAFASLAMASTSRYGPCTAVDGRPGTCLEPSQCKTKTGTVSGRCPGSTPKCCLADPKPTTPTSPANPPPSTSVPCTDFVGNKGTCLLPVQCNTGLTVSGRCGSGPTKCCLQPTPLPANPAAAVGQTMYFNLASQAFPNNGYPGAAVYVPKAYVNTKAGSGAPLNVVVFIHGFVNCIQNVLLPSNQNVACSTNGPKRHSYNLIGQVEATGKNVLLVAIETARDQNSGDPGQVGKPNGLRNFLDELLSKSLAPVFGARSVNDITRLIVFGHSAAYQSTSAFAVQSGVPSLREIHLLDSLYGFVDRYQTWITAHKDSFHLSQYRFTNTYFASTQGNAIAQAQSIAKIVPSDVYAWVKDGTVVSDPSLWTTPVVFKASNIHDHDGIPLNFVQPILSESPI